MIKYNRLKIGGDVMANIYLDYAATSRKHFDIIEKNLNILKEIYANPSSGHT